jgi:lysophospholipase L1-like esterase
MDVINYSKIKKVQQDLSEHKLDYVERMGGLSFANNEIIKSKNLIDKSEGISGKYVNVTLGTLSDNPDYVAFTGIEINETNTYVFSGDNLNSKYYGWYKKDGTYLSGGNSVSKEILLTPPTGSETLSISGRKEAIDTYMLEIGSVATEYEPFYKKFILNELVVSRNNLGGDIVTPPQRIHNISDIFAQWRAGNKFPIAFLGDSTTAGDTTTGFVYNVVGTDYINTKAYPYLLEQKAKEFFGNSNLRVYNAGFSGTNAGSIIPSLNGIFGDGTPYADVKMVGISYGINDRHNNGDTTILLLEGFKANMRRLINYFIDKGIQPFLITPQVVIQPFADIATPLNDSLNTQALICTAIKDLANEFNLEVIDKNYYTSKFIENTMLNTDAVMPDSLHFSDLGHKFEADMHFHTILKSSVEVKSDMKITPMNPYMRGSFTRYQYDPLDTPINGFPARLIRSNASLTDRKDLELEIFISQKPMTLKAYVQTPYAMYVKINGGEPILLNSQEVTIGVLEMGLHKIELWSGNNITNFLGFKLISLI